MKIKFRPDQEVEKVEFLEHVVFNLGVSMGGSGSPRSWNIVKHAPSEAFSGDKGKGDVRGRQTSIELMRDQLGDPKRIVRADGQATFFCLISHILLRFPYQIRENLDEILSWGTPHKMRLIKRAMEEKNYPKTTGVFRSDTWVIPCTPISKIPHYLAACVILAELMAMVATPPFSSGVEKN